MLGCLREKRPEYVYSVQKMASFLKDVHLIEAQLGDLSLGRDSLEKVYGILEKELMEKNNIDDSLYTLSLEYYVTHPQEMEKVYTIIADSLGLEQRLLSVKDSTEEK